MAKNTKTDKTTDITQQAEKVETTAAELTPVTETDEEKNIREKTETERLSVEKVASDSKATREQASKSTKAQNAFIDPYKKAYPKEKAFIVTSDKQVFLVKDRGLALLHQTSLNNGEKVQTIPIK